MKKSHSTDPSNYLFIKSIRNMIRRCATIRSFGRFTCSMRLWYQRLRNILRATRFWWRKYKISRMRRETGWLFGLRRVRRKLEGLLIWLIRLSSVRFKDACEHMVLMCLWTCIWNWSIIAELRLNGKIWRKRFA